MNWKAALGRLGLVVGGLLAGVLAAELAARLIRPEAHADLLFNSPDASPMGLYVNDPVLIMSPTPGFDGRSGSVGYSVPLRFNELGVRGPAPDGQKSWIAVGDSFTLSVQVSEEDSFEGHLSEALGLRVWNAGVDGYSTWQAMERYRRLDDSLASNVVLLTFFLGNDLHDNILYPQIVQTMRNVQAGTPIMRPPSIWWQSFLLKNSYIYAHLRVRDRAQQLAAGTDPVLGRWKNELAIFSMRGQGQLRGLAERSWEPLIQLRDLVHQRGDRLVVAVAPPAFVIEQERLDSTFRVVGLDPSEAQPDAPAQAVLRMLQQMGVLACDLTPGLRAAQAEGDSLYFTYDGHWTPRGHAVVSESLVQCFGS
jgi:hypothetical protein